MTATSLAGVYSDGLVLQRNKDILISGSEASLPEVRVTLAGITLIAEVTDGCFKVIFPPMEAAEGLTITVEGTDTVEVTDICIGDVYMLSGQSNMELPVSRTYDMNRDKVDAGDYPLIRQFTVEPDYELPLKGEASSCAFPGGSWKRAEGPDKMSFSAVGFYAAQKIYEKNRVPIGFILNAKGGASIESYMSEEDLAATGIPEDAMAPFRGKGVIREYVASAESYTVSWRNSTVDEAFEIDKAIVSATEVELPGIAVTDTAGSVWFVKEFELEGQPEGECFLRLGDLIDADVTYVNGTEVGRTEYQYPPRKYYFDGSLLRPGRNTIAVRLLVELGRGGFVPGHPYFLRTDKGTVDLIIKHDVPVGWYLSKYYISNKATVILCVLSGLLLIFLLRVGHVKRRRARRREALRRAKIRELARMQMEMDADRIRRDWNSTGYDPIAPRTTDLRREAVSEALEEEKGRRWRRRNKQ